MADMTFPEACARLRLIAEDLRDPHITVAQCIQYADDLATIEKRVRRRPPARRAMPRARMVDDTLRDQIRAYAAANPTMSYRKIGAHFNVDGGRVSEALVGFREEA